MGVPLEVSKGLSPLSQDGIYFRREVKNVSKMFPTFSKLPLLYLKVRRKNEKNSSFKCCKFCFSGCFKCG
ncbi:hypothetical protein BWG59_02005 [Campylobacter coli]|nr:hypothetical protein [Campylobacter coli]